MVPLQFPIILPRNFEGQWRPINIAEFEIDGVTKKERTMVNFDLFDIWSLILRLYVIKSILAGWLKFRCHQTKFVCINDTARWKFTLLVSVWSRRHMKRASSTFITISRFEKISVESFCVNFQRCNARAFTTAKNTPQCTSTASYSVLDFMLVSSWRRMLHVHSTLRLIKPT